MPRYVCAVDRTACSIPARRRFSAILFSLVFALCGTWSVSALAEKMVIAEGAHVIGYLAIYIAQDEGYFAAEGLDVDIVPTRGSAQAVAAIIGRSADVALATVSDVANAVSQGRNLAIIAGITSQPQMMLTVSTDFAKKHNISADLPLENGCRALKDGTFAVSAPGSMTDDVMRTLLTMGISPLTMMPKSWLSAAPALDARRPGTQKHRWICPVSSRRQSGGSGWQGTHPC